MKSVFLKASIVILGILLCANLVVSLLITPTTSYAAKHIQYKVIVPDDPRQMENALNKYSSEGWEIAATIGGSVILKK